MKTNAICKHTKNDELEIHYTDESMTSGKGMILLDMRLLRSEGIGWQNKDIQFADFDEQSQREICRVYELAYKNPQ